MNQYVHNTQELLTKKSTTKLGITSTNNSKRPRSSPAPNSAHDVVAKIHQSVTTEQRLRMLQSMIVQLEEGLSPVSSFCEALLEAGAINALCLQLGFVLNRNETIKGELEPICQTISLIYRGSQDNTRDESFAMVGSEMVGLLLKAYSWGITTPILSTIHMCSGSSQGTNTLLKTRGLLFSLVEFLNGSNMESNCLLETLGILKNLSYYAEDYRLQMVESPDLMAQLSAIPFSEASSQEKALERLSAIFRNLAVTPSTRPILANQTKVLNAISRMGSYPSKHIIRNVLNCCLSIAQDADSCVVLTLHGDGILLNLMKRFMMHEADSAIRKRAARVVRLLVSSSLCSHDTVLIQTLSHRALYDISNEVRSEATDALVKLIEFVKAPMPQHMLILDALTHLASSPTVSPEMLATAFRKQTAHPGNRAPIADKKMLLDSFARLSMSHDATNACREDVCCAILDLSRDEENKGRIATYSILDALVQNATGTGRLADHSELRNFAVEALLNLASTPTNRKAMATHDRLVQTLIQCAAASVSDEGNKENLKKTILVLVSEL